MRPSCPSRNTTRTDRQWVNNDQISDWEITTYAIQDDSEQPDSGDYF